MKAKINRKLLAMMAACAAVANVAGIAAAHAQGMPADAQQLVQTMRPMYMAQDMSAAAPAQTAADPQQSSDDGSAYGGMTPGSASGRRDGGCNVASCNTFFGQ
ncbi:hypothetical protein [Caballeronia sp. J97]|uniref:hypothetical protein n=1 Tax=Caballeronia sp. J97 TaxID=2805429 RepID=UPI002AB2A90F|nr:hypothetical protein [Caballeronia sp. J97]